MFGVFICRKKITKLLVYTVHALQKSNKNTLQIKLKQLTRKPHTLIIAQNQSYQQHLIKHRHSRATFSRKKTEKLNFSGNLL